MVNADSLTEILLQKERRNEEKKRSKTTSKI